MIRRRLIAVWLIGFAFISVAAEAAEPVVTEGRVAAVIVYQGQALVTREIDVPQAQGLLEVVVSNLPENVLPGSLFAEPADGVQIRSVRYRARPIEEDVRKEVRELDQQIQDVADKLAAIAEEHALLNQRSAYLAQLEKFSAATSQLELKSGVLNAETLKDLSQFLFTQRDAISQRQLELAREERSHNEQRDLLVRKKDTISAGSARTAREAIVFINAPQAGAAKLRLSYLVNNASWSPSYNLRATDARDEITVEYNASIQQMSGEDWNDVEMVLSTATPSLVATAPKLDPLTIKLGQIPQSPAQQPLSAALNYKQVQENLAQLGRQRGMQDVDRVSRAAPASTEEVAFGYSGRAPNGAMGGGAGGVGGWDFSAANAANTDQSLNRAACELQLLDFNNSLSELKSEASHVSESRPRASASVTCSPIAPAYQAAPTIS